MWNYGEEKHAWSSKKAGFQKLKFRFKQNKAREFGHAEMKNIQSSRKQRNLHTFMKRSLIMREIFIWINTGKAFFKWKQEVKLSF